MRKKSRAEWLDLLEEAGLPNSPINTVAEVVGDENLRYREMIVDLEQPNLGALTVVGSPFRMSATPASVRTAAPRVGEHSRQVLKEMLGYSESRIEGLMRGKIVMSASKGE
jgi:CoA:oxalate CoA-transferase